MKGLMKNTGIFLIIITALLAACENREKVFPDYDYNAVYFPVQYPVRTLNLGYDRFNNSMDRELRFDIGISIGGMYENKENWTVSYVVDESLCDSLGNGVQALPQSYYTLSPAGEVIIPPGSFSGLISVQLTEAFLSDPLSTGNHFVVPLKLTATSADSILTGLPLSYQADKRIIAEWDPGAPPKDFTLFMIKYINEYHGSYLRRGADYTLDAGGSITDTLIYRGKYVENDQVVKLTTSGRYELNTNFSGIGTGNGNGVRLTVDPGTGSIAVDSIPGSSTVVPETGNGRFMAGGDSWGGKARNAVYLNYKYIDGGTEHLVYDTLVYRDNGIKYEEFSPVVVSR
jgi:hypothetical protein